MDNIASDFHKEEKKIDHLLGKDKDLNFAMGEIQFDYEFFENSRFCDSLEQICSEKALQGSQFTFLGNDFL